MKKILMSTAIAAIFLATSCQNEEIISSQSTGNVTVNASTMVESRTYVQGQTVYWSEGDKLFAFGGEVSGTLTLQGKGGSTNGTFSGFVSGNPDNLKGIVYPAEMVQYKNGKVTINIGEIDAENSNAPMFAGFGSNINFTHLAAMVRMQINDVPATGNDLTISGTGIGQITIDAEGKITYSQSSETITVTGLKQGTNEICFPVFTQNVNAAGSVPLQLAIGDGTSISVNIPLKAEALSVNNVPILTYNEGTKQLTEETTLPEGNEQTGDYVISTVTELIQFANLVNNDKNSFSGKTVTLGADIDLQNQEWTPINGFHGTFDGKNHTISNLKCTYLNNDKVRGCGLFNSVIGKLMNVKIDRATINGYGYASALTAYIYGDIENCHVSNSTIVGRYWQAGSLVAQFNSGIMKECSATNVNVISGSAAGTLIGLVNETGGTRKIENCEVRNCSVSMYDGGFGGDYDEMFGAIAGGLNAENMTVEFNGCSVTQTIVLESESSMFYGYKETDVEVYIDGCKELASGLCYDAETNTYNISSANGFVSASAYFTKGGIFNLMKDIDMTGIEFQPKKASGNFVFNGNGNTISNLQVKGKTHAALFADTDNFVITDLTISKSVFEALNQDGQDSAGAFISFMETHSNNAHKLTNCHVVGCTIGSAKYVGGLVGFKDGNHILEIDGCSVEGCTLISKYTEDNGANYKGHCGGLVGYFSNTGSISDCNVVGNTFETMGPRCGIVIGSLQTNFSISGTQNGNKGLQNICGQINKGTNWNFK